MTSLEINGVVYSVPMSETIIQSCYRIGIEIPRFCYHEKLSIAGNCRMCLVEVSYPKMAKPVASCAFPVTANMKIFTNTVLVKKARESVLEFLLANHPLDCPICDQGGECDLQDETILFGSDRGRFYELKRAVSDKECGPLIKTTMTRCIHCTRCVRFCSEIAGVDSFGVLGRGSFMEIGTYIDNLVESEISGNVIDLCPVGALTSKPYSFTARPWELRTVQTIDVTDSFFSSIRLDLRGSEIVRVLPLMHSGVNEEWISDRSRFFYDGVKRQRLLNPGLMFNGSFVQLSWEKCFKILSSIFYYYTKTSFIHQRSSSASSFFGYLIKRETSFIHGMVGKLVDCESIFIFKHFLTSIGSENLYLNLAVEFSSDFRFEYLSNFSISSQAIDSLISVDLCVLVNLNPRLDFPVLNIKLRKSCVESGLIVFLFGGYSNLNYFFLHLSNNYQGLCLLFQGKSILCQKLVIAKVPLVIVSRDVWNEGDGPFFSNFFKSCKYLISRKAVALNPIQFISTSTAFISSSELSFSPNQFTVPFRGFQRYSLFYFLNANLNYFQYLNKMNFSIYQGHHGDDLASLCDILLPMSLFLEGGNYFIDFRGFPKRSKSVLPTPGTVREGWQIFISLYLYFRKFFLLKATKIPIMFTGPISYVQQQLHVLLPQFLKSYQLYTQHELSSQGFLTTYSSFMPLTFFQSDSFFCYMSDPITRSSQILALCTQRFIISKNNFFE